ncbi:MarR family transcriptional regulator [Cupriavidus sp.]|uniref:MarR family transcriptional regulator n=1 Tax=Cupriavidus sp. TaxID=1873897 RepID=UPI003D0E526E
MRPRALEPTESVLLALMDSVREWQRVLDQTLSDVGLDYAKWILLRAIRQDEFVRHEPWLGPMLISVPQSESLLHTLHADRWIEFDPAGQPFIPAGAVPRVERVWSGMKALHSVSVAPFSTEERTALTASLRRMKATLHDHSLRLGRQAEQRVEPAH